MTARFQSGDALGFIGRDFVAVVERSAPVALQHLLTQAIAEGIDFETVFDTIGSVGIRNLASFAIVAQEETILRIVTRGEATVTAGDGTSSSTFDGRHAASWTEHNVDTDTCTNITLALSNTSAAHEFILTEGTAPVASIALEISHFNEDRASQLDGYRAAIARANPSDNVAATRDQPEIAEPHIDKAIAGVVGATEPVCNDPEPSIHAAADPHTEAATSAPASAAHPTEPGYFDHLLDHTMYRNVEAGAIRPLAASPTGENHLQAASAETSVRDDLRVPTSHGVDPDVNATIASHQATMSFSESETFTPSQLIESIPGAIPTVGQPESPSVVTPRSMATATPREVPRAGDHDGHTMAMSSIRALREAKPISTIGPTVQAVHCPNRHANQPHVERCRICNATINDRTIDHIVRPSLGLLQFANGEAYPVDRPMLLGRRPTAAQEPTVLGEPARMVTLKDEGQSLSKVHAEIRIEDWQVSIVDRYSTNHTYVTLPGMPTVQVHPGEPTQIVVGTVVDLGGAIEFRYTAGESS